MPYNDEYNKMVARDIDYFNRRYIMHCGTTGQGTIDYRIQLVGGCNTCEGSGAGSKVFHSDSDSEMEGGAILGLQTGTVLGGPKTEKETKRLLTSFSSLGAPIGFSPNAISNPVSRAQDAPPGPPPPTPGAPPAGAAPAPPVVGGAILGPVKSFENRYRYQSPNFSTMPVGNSRFSSLARPQMPLSGIAYRAGKNTFVRDLGSGPSLNSETGYAGAGMDSDEEYESDSSSSSSSSSNSHKLNLLRRDHKEMMKALKRGREKLDGGYCGAPVVSAPAEGAGNTKGGKPGKGGTPGKGGKPGKDKPGSGPGDGPGAPAPPPPPPPKKQPPPAKKPPPASNPTPPSAPPSVPRKKKPKKNPKKEPEPGAPGAPAPKPAPPAPPAPAPAPSKKPGKPGKPDKPAPAPAPAPKPGAPGTAPPSGPTWLTTANKAMDLGLEVVKLVGQFKMYSDDPAGDFINMYEDELCDDLGPNPTIEDIIQCLKDQDYDDDEIQKLLSLSQGAIGEAPGKEVTQSLKVKNDERKFGNKDKNTTCMDAMNEVGDAEERVQPEQKPVRKQASYFGGYFKETLNATSGRQTKRKVNAQMNSRIGYGGPLVKPDFKMESCKTGEGKGAPKKLAVGKGAPKKLAPKKSGDGKPKKVNKRAEIVRKVMAEKGLKMIEASKYVKEHNLY